MKKRPERKLPSGLALFRFRNRLLESEYQSFRSDECQSSTRQLLLVGMLLLVIASVLEFNFASYEYAAAAAKIRGYWMGPPLLLTYLVWSVQCRHYLRQWAGVLVGLAVGVGSLAIGHTALTMGVPISVGGYLVVIVYTFFFLGLRFDLALLTASIIVAISLAFSVAGGGPVPAIVSGFYSTFVMLVTCAVGAAQLEAVRRRDFLARREIFTKAHVDKLTGLPNRRSLDLHLSALWSKESTTDRHVAVCLLDIDHFKNYNDSYGHQAGDQALKKVAATLRRSLYRPEDFVARYGGEEFAIIAEGVDRESASKIVERVREAVYDLAIPHDRPGPENRITISAGLVVHNLRETERSMAGILQAADEALYGAKAGGRNRVVVASDLVEGSETGMFSIAQYEQKLA